jgi:hypothetical protein
VRLPDATRSSLRALLVAELADAGTRARDAGCPPEALTEALDVRLGLVAVDARLAPDLASGP